MHCDRPVLAQELAWASQHPDDLYKLALMERSAADVRGIVLANLDWLQDVSGGRERARGRIRGS